MFLRRWEVEKIYKGFLASTKIYMISIIIKYVYMSESFMQEYIIYNKIINIHMFMTTTCFLSYCKGSLAKKDRILLLRNNNFKISGGCKIKE